MPFYVVTYNGGTQESFEGVDDEDGLYTGLNRVPRPALIVEPRPARANRILRGEFMEIREIPVIITRDDKTVIFTGVRRHPMTKLPQFEGKISGGLSFTWNP